MAEARTYQRYDFLAMAVIKAENGRKVNISTLVENISKKLMLYWNLLSRQEAEEKRRRTLKARSPG
jgi:hypothetical protein